MNKTFEVNDEELETVAGGRFVATVTGESGAYTALHYEDEYYRYLVRNSKDINHYILNGMITKAHNLRLRWQGDDEDHTPEEYRTAIYNMPIA